MDILDRAQRTETMHIAAAMAGARGHITQGPARDTCRNCEEPIPEARRRAMPGCQLCVDCQRESEKKGR